MRQSSLKGEGPMVIRANVPENEKLEWLKANASRNRIIEPYTEEENPWLELNHGDERQFLLDNHLNYYIESDRAQGRLEAREFIALEKSKFNGKILENGNP